MTSRLYALCTLTELVVPSQLYGMARALEIANSHLVDHWATELGLERAAIEVCADPTSLPRGCYPVVFVDESTEPGVLAEHFVGDDFGPVARVYMAASSGLNFGDWSASAGCDHELKESEGDPLCDAWRDHPTRPGVEVALELCDPTEQSYEVTHAGQTWLAENFVTPAWFDPNGKAPYDYLGLLTAPGQIGRDSYVILRDKATGEVWTEDTFGARVPLSARRKPGALHPLARTVRRLARAA